METNSNVIGHIFQVSVKMKLNNCSNSKTRCYFRVFVIVSRGALGFSRYPEACCVDWLPKDTGMPKTTCGDRQQKDPRL